MTTSIRNHLPGAGPDRPHLALVLLSLLFAGDLATAQVPFFYPAGPERRDGLVMVDLEFGLGSGTVLFDVWNETFHPALDFVRLYEIDESDILGIQLNYYNYHPLPGSSELAPLAFTVNFTSGAEVLTYEHSEPEPGSSGTVDLLSTPIGSDLARVVGSYEFDPVREVAANPVHFSLTSNATAGDGQTGAATFEVLIQIPPPGRFVRCDLDANGKLNIPDVILMLLQLFRIQPITCFDAADCSDDGRFNIPDVIFLLLVLFKRPGPDVPPPFPDPGTDETPDRLRCNQDLLPP